MKRILLAAPLVGALTLSGCNDLLQEEPESFLSSENFYASAADARAAVAAAYEPLREVPVSGWQAHQGQEDPGDLANSHPSEQEPQGLASGYLAWNAATRNQINQWHHIFRSIYRANLALEKLPDTPLSDAEKAVLTAELKFIRAFDYIYLVRLYGDVPLHLTLEDHRNLNPVRTPLAEVYAQVIKDLTEVEAVLPATRPVSEWGRPTQGAAWAALADLYLFNSSRYNSGQWQQAADWSKKIIDSGRYRLLDDYISSYLPTNKANAEMIWVRTSSGLDNRSSTDVQSGFFPREVQPGGGFGVITPTRYAVEEVYEAGDYRRTQVFRFTGCNTTGSQCFPNGFPVGPHPYKFRPTNLTGPDDVDHPWYHYNETLLVYAEAQNELGNTAEAIRYVNMIRARARKGAGSENRTSPADLPLNLSKAAARDAIYKERTRELIWEFERWWDLVRRDTIEPGYFASELTAHDPYATRFGPPEQFRKLFPIPQTEIDATGGSLVQNPGY